EVYLDGGKVHYLPLDCTKIKSAAELIDVLTELRDYGGTRVVFLDEVHRLQHRAMDEQLLVPLRERDFVWVVASAHTANLEPMFLNRFVKLETELPTLEELVLWLADRCSVWGVRHEDEALIRLAERAGRLPGIALQAVDYASLDPEVG